MGFKARRANEVERFRAITRIGGDRIRRLLVLEKERVDHPADRVRFTCVSDVTKYYWCGLSSILRARQREEMLFGVYLCDRLGLAWKRGEITGVPDVDLDVLAICASLPCDVVPEEVWREPHAAAGGWDVFKQATEPNTLAGFNPSWSQIGSAAEAYLARKLPTARWHFEWNNYVLVCDPDGVTDEYVYEFKSVKRRDWISERARRAVLQAQLGAYFFKRNAVEVELVALDTQDMVERKADAGTGDVLQVMRKFNLAETEQIVPMPPQSFKCLSCDYFQTPACDISPLLTV